MPDIECKRCSSINIVPEGARSFTCNICGVTQEIEPEFDNAQQYLNNTFLGETRSWNTSGRVARSASPKTFSDEAVNEDDVPPEDVIYYSAVARMSRNSINNYIRALEGLQSIPDWKDSAKLIAECQEKIDYFTHLQELENAEKKRRTKKRLAVILPCVFVFLLIVGAVLCYAFVYRPNSQYLKAVALENGGDIVGAYESYIDLSGYKDSEARAENIFAEYKSEKLKSAKVGENVYFGYYEQDNNTSNGKEDLKWRVLKKNGSRLLVITEYGIDCATFNKVKEAVTWESSTIRKTLNTSFIASAFDDNQRSRILDTDVVAEKNENYDTSPGKNTVDKVFLLSLSEAEKLMSREDRQCVPTAFSIAKECKTQKKRFSSECTACWLLRTPGLESTDVVYVQYDGIIRVIGTDVESSGAVIRPAMWIDVK